MESKQNRDTFVVCLLVVVATFAVYAQVIGFDFINYDDPHYVVDNPRVQQGFSWESIKWAFTTTYASNWHPLTWLSHILDWNLYGPKAGGHHLTNVLLHIASALVLFFTFRLMTGTIWRSGFVAALFALHPMHVESVAWVSERKDVLCGLFWMLTMLFYSRYIKTWEVHERANTTASIYYALALVCFALGLLAKQMLVTLPFVLLLIDIWPFNRLRSFGWKSLVRLTGEKIPFFVVAAIFVLIAVWSQNAGRAIASVSSLPFDQRFENAVVSYLRYFCKFVWPSNLSVFYPYPAVWPLDIFIAGAMFLLFGFVVAIWRLKRNPAIFVGWCWFLGTLVPVIGIIQVGSQSMADRYSYIPFIGLFVIVAWSVPEYFFGNHLRKWTASVAAILFLGVCCILATIQTRFWKTSDALFRHALESTEQNGVAHLSYGVDLLLRKQTNAAVEQFKAALNVNPGDSLAYANLAGIAVSQGDWDEAERNFQAALRISPDDFALHNSIGLALARQGKFAEAIDHYKQALELNPDSSKVAYNLGNAYWQDGKLEEAKEAFKIALHIDPKDVAAHLNLGALLLAQQKLDEAEDHLLTAIRLRPDLADAHRNLASVYIARHKPGLSDGFQERAIEELGEAIRVDGKDAAAHFQLAMVLAARFDTTNAILEYQKALEQKPDWPEALNNLAWILATHPDAKVRNGEEAVRLAEKACQLVGFKTPVFIGTLAAAYAEAGHFEKAIEMGEAAYQIANSAGQIQIAEKNLELLKLYRAGHPYWEPVAKTNQ